MQPEAQALIDELGLRDVYSYYQADYAGISLFFDRGELSPEFLEATRADLREGLPVWRCHRRIPAICSVAGNTGARK
mgnify:CR=1 FL=1